jgi:hypothetical protein
MQAIQVEVPVTLAPLAHGEARQVHPLGNGCVGVTGSASLHDLRPLHDRVGKRAGVGDAPELLNLVVAENQQRLRATNYHETTLHRRHYLF